MKGSYIIFDQGLTGITKEAFPAWIAMMFLTMCLVWFVLGYETAKKHNLSKIFVILFIIGILLLALPSII